MSSVLDDWSQLHGGIEPSRLVRGWLRGVWFVARPLRRVPPDALTLLGALASVGVAASSTRRPRLAAGLVGAAVACDSLDGAVALTAGRATARGERLDHLADRVSDAALAHALWQRGAPRPLAAAALGLTFVHETGRSRPTVVTVAERPSRVICGLIGLLAPHRHAATISAGVWVGLEAVALVQLRAARMTR